MNRSFIPGDYDAITDSAGRVHVVGMFAGWSRPGDTGFGCLVYWRSVDDGKTFSTLSMFFNGTVVGGGTPPDACGHVPASPSIGSFGLVDRPWFSSYGDSMYIAYKCLTGICLNTSHDGGLSWSKSTAVPTTECNCNVTNGGVPGIGYIAVGQTDGTIYISYSPTPLMAPNSRTNVIKVAVSVDGAKTFQYHLVAQMNEAQQFSLIRGETFFPIAVDTVGNVYVAWSDNSMGPFNIFLSSSRDKGNDWSSPIIVNNVGMGMFVYPWLAAGSQGNVILDWWGTPDALGPPMVSNSTRWYLYSGTSSSALDPLPSFVETKVSSLPLAVGGGPRHPTNEFYQVGIDAGGHALVAWPNLTAFQSQPAVYDCYSVEFHLLYGKCGPIMLSTETSGPNLLAVTTTTTSTFSQTTSQGTTSRTTTAAATTGVSTSSTQSSTSSSSTTTQLQTTPASQSQMYPIGEIAVGVGIAIAGVAIALAIRRRRR